MNRFLIRDRGFYRTFIRLASALMLEQAVVLFVNLIDNVMIGAYSEISLSGVAAVNMIQFFVQQIAFGIANAVLVLAGQYWGKKELAPIRRITAVGVWIALVFAALMFAAVSLAPDWCVGLFVTDAAMIGEGVRYLDILRWSYPFFALTTVLLSTMRSIENVRLALRVSIMSLLVNCVINYLLIGGRLGCPELGVRGAAIGTLTARILEFLAVGWYVFFHDKKLCLRPSALFSFDRQLAADYSRIALPIVFQAAMWGGCNCMQTAILGHLNGSAVAAYSISSTIFLLLKVASVGAATAAAIMIAKQIGGGCALSELKKSCRTMQLIFIGLGVTLGLVLFAIRTPLLSFYELSAETRLLAEQFLLLQCCVVCTMSYQMPVSMGILRGGGDTRYSMILDLIVIWCVVIPVSWLAAFRWNAAPIVVAACLNFDQFFKCIPNAIRVNRYRWMKKLTRETAEE